MDSGMNDVVEVESPATEIATIQNDGDPDVLLNFLEKKAALAPRFRAAQDAILASQTYSEDWREFDGKMCLSSAGAERIGRLFDIQFFEVVCSKEEFTDAIGKGYRYVYEGKAAMGSRITYAMGVYSSRDKFLGKIGDDFRALEEIDENNIRRAAYNIMKGNAIKSLLGLRGIPVAEFNKIMERANRDPAKAGKTQHGKGTQGGTTADDTAKQKELAEICIEIANAGKIVVASDDFKTFTLDDAWDTANPMTIAKEICVTLSTFIGRENKKVAGLGAKDLKGVRLDKTLEKAREIRKHLETQA